MAVAPRISVVIPTRGRETRLAFALEALAGQTLDAEDFEVLVVRDGGTQERAAGPVEGLDVRFLERVPRGGPAAARNVGWREARAPIVAFTDDDCRPTAGWLEALLAAAGGDEALVQGRTEPDPDERHLLGGLARTQIVEAPTGWYETCNVAYPRALLERLGGFDEGYTRAGGEDTDIALRALELGARAIFEPRALVWHAVHPRHLPEALRETLRWGANPRLLARHPRLRGALPLGLFWKSSHARLLLALAGGALLRRSSLAAVLVLPYLELHARAYERSARGLARAALDLPSQTAVDGLEVGVTAAAAARARVVVL